VTTKEQISTYEADQTIDTAVLLYSGGLDTSCMVKYIQDAYDADVITLTLDLGQPGVNLQAVKDKALDLGATEAHIIDAKDEFAEQYLSKAIKANATYQGYPLSTAIARYLTVEKAVKIAEDHSADAIAHGSTGKGNDQVRFDAAIQNLGDGIQALAPVREWSMTRDKELAYAEKHGIPVEAEHDSPYSTDENIWGKSSECGPLEDPATAPPEDVFQFITPPEQAPNKPETVTIGFEDGLPTSLDGEELSLLQIIQQLNQKAGTHGIGIIDITEDRIIGLKSREIYECPAATVLLAAHEDLQQYCCTKHENQIKGLVEQKWAELAYSGLWHDPAMDHLDAFLESINTGVTGAVDVKLYKGQAQITGRSSPNALYDHNLATYQEGETFNQAASPGFIELWNLQTKMAQEVDKQ